MAYCGDCGLPALYTCPVEGKRHLCPMCATRYSIFYHVGLGGEKDRAWMKKYERRWRALKGAG
jgi:hypothetical protein